MRSIFEDFSEGATFVVFLQVFITLALYVFMFSKLNDLPVNWLCLLQGVGLGALANTS